MKIWWFHQINYFLAVNIVHIATLDDWWLSFWFHIVSVEVFQTKNDRQGFPSNVVFFDISYSSFLAWMIGGSSLDVGDLLGHPWVSSTKKSWQHVWSNDALSMIYSSWFKRNNFGESPIYYDVPQWSLLCRFVPKRRQFVPEGDTKKLALEIR